MDLPFRMIQESEIEKWRAETFWTKEPETIAWIDSFREKDVFFDIGANVGVYTLYAASRKNDLRVYSFEPSKINFYRLKENIEMNQFHNVYCARFGFSSEVSIGSFEDTGNQPGYSKGMTKSIEWSDATEWLVFIETIDHVCEVLKGIVPNHIKIDVDGGEFGIIEGALSTLTKNECRTVLVEVDPTCTNIPVLDRIMAYRGFTKNNIWNSMDNHSRYRRLRENIIVENVIYSKGAE